MRRILGMFLLSLCLASSASALTPAPPFLFDLYPSYSRVTQFAQTPDGRIIAPLQDGNAVFVYTETGAFVNSFGGGSDQPTGVALDDSGNVYIAEQHAHRIAKYSPFFVLAKKWGGFGSGPGQLQNPTNLAFSPDFSKLYVTELTGGRVSVFDRNGNFLSSFGSQGSAPGQFNYPFSIVVEPGSGDLFITNELNNRVDRWTANGTYLSSFGSLGSAPGEFNFPVGIGRDPLSGDLYVTDQLNNRIQRVKPNGTPVTVWGSFGSGPNQFYNPWAVFISALGRIWIGDTYNYRIAVYGPGAVTAARSTTWGALKAAYH